MKIMIQTAILAGLTFGVQALSLAEEGTARVKFAGCSISAGAYMKDMAKSFEEKTGIPVEVKGGGVPMGIAGTLSGNVDLGGSCRHLLKKEEEQGAVGTVVGYDMLMFIVHPDNLADSLTLEQVRSVFSGKISNWKELGGLDQPIILVGREAEDAGVAVMFREMVMKDLPLSDKRLDLLSSSEIEKEVEANRYGIGVTGISALLRKVKVLKVDGVAPTRDNFRNGTYPLVRPFYLMTKGAPQGLARQFIDFVLSPEGQLVMAKNAVPMDDYLYRTTGDNKKT